MCGCGCVVRGRAGALCARSGNLLHFCPCYFKRGDRNFRSFRLCVWHRSLFRAPGASPRFVAAHAGDAHCRSSGRRAGVSQGRDASCHQCSQLVNKDETLVCLVHVT